MALKDILLLGDPLLYKKSEPVKKEEADSIVPVTDELFKTIAEFRQKHGTGRGIAAPQLGVHKRIICINIDRPLEIINPVLSELSDELIELWDDCMSFPGLLVKVRRHKSLKLSFVDLYWQQHSLYLHDDMAELIQHEYDHLEGILAIQRAVDNKSFRWKSGSIKYGGL